MRFCRWIGSHIVYWPWPAPIKCHKFSPVVPICVLRAILRKTDDAAYEWFRDGYVCGTHYPPMHNDWQEVTL